MSRMIKLATLLSSSFVVVLAARNSTTRTASIAQATSAAVAEASTNAIEIRLRFIGLGLDADSTAPVIGPSRARANSFRRRDGRRRNPAASPVAVGRAVQRQDAAVAIRRHSR